MAANQGEMHSAMTETSSSKFIAAQIKERRNFSWAQILTKSISEDQKSAKPYPNQAEPKCSSQNSAEQQRNIEQSAKKGYLDLSSGQPQNQKSYADLLNLSSNNQPGVVSKGSDTGGQPNPSSGREKEKVKGATSITGPCSHCKRRGHEKDGCWFLYPHLKPTKKRGGGTANDEKKRSENGDSREGEKTQSCLRLQEKKAGPY